MTYINDWGFVNAIQPSFKQFAPAANVDTAIITPAQNSQGLILLEGTWFASIPSASGTFFSLGFKFLQAADNSANSIEIGQTNMVLVGANYFYFGKITQPLYIPAGFGMYFFSNALATINTNFLALPV